MSNPGILDGAVRPESGDREIHPAVSAARDFGAPLFNDKLMRSPTKLRQGQTIWPWSVVAKLGGPLHDVQIVIEGCAGLAPILMHKETDQMDFSAYLGLVPGEHSSGRSRRGTGITKAGSIIARRLIVKAAWAYRMPAKVGQAMRQRHGAIPTEILDIAWKAQVRLCNRYRRMLAQRKKAPIVITAVAHELVGFIWAIARQISPGAMVA